MDSSSQLNLKRASCARVLKKYVFDILADMTAQLDPKFGYESRIFDVLEVVYMSFACSFYVYFILG